MAVDIGSGALEITGQLNINGSSVISSSRELQNIASLDSTTASTIQAVAVEPNFAAWNEIVFMNTPSRVVASDVYYNGSNVTADSGLGKTTYEFGTHQFTSFINQSLGAPSSFSSSSSWYSNNPEANLTDAGVFNSDTTPFGNYASNFNAGSGSGTSLTVTYTYSSSKTVNSTYGAIFSNYLFTDLTWEAYVNNSWTTLVSYDPRPLGNNARTYKNFSPVTATQFRWTATAATVAYVFYEMQFLSAQVASGKTATTPHESVSSVGNYVTAYAVVKGTNSGWTFEASRDGGSNYASPYISVATAFGDYYVYKLTYNLSSQTSASKLGMKVTFPSNASAQFYGCKLEG
jgi:hypothetical protein